MLLSPPQREQLPLGMTEAAAQAPRPVSTVLGRPPITTTATPFGFEEDSQQNGALIFDQVCDQGPCHTLPMSCYSCMLLRPSLLTIMQLLYGLQNPLLGMEEHFLGEKGEQDVTKIIEKNVQENKENSNAKQKNLITNANISSAEAPNTSKAELTIKAPGQQLLTSFADASTAKWRCINPGM